MLQVLRTSAEKDWEWIDVQSPTAMELQEIAERYGLHQTSVKDCLQPEHLPKYEVIQNIIFIITRIYDSNAHAEADTIQELTTKVAIFFSDKFLITIHRQPLKHLEEVKQEFIDTPLVNNSFELLLKVVRSSFKSFEAPSPKFTLELDYYEAQIFLQPKIPPLTKGLYHLKRRAAVSKKILQLSDPILVQLKQNGQSPPEVQDLVDYFVRVSTFYDEINDSVNNLLNMYISLSSQRTNEVMRILTIFSVFFMPLTFIAGIYGMNFEIMPELGMKLGYPLTILTMALVSVSIYFWFRKKGWM